MNLKLEQLKKAIIKPCEISQQEIDELMGLLPKDSKTLSQLFIDFLEMEFLICYAEPISPHYNTYAQNFYLTLSVALENGLNPNEFLSYDDGSDGDNIMWAVIGYARQSDIAPKIMKLLLDYGGDPNLKIGSFGETVFSEVDDFFWIDGEDQYENFFKCWLLLAAYGGDKDNKDFLPLKMLNYHKQDELKDYNKYKFVFETVMPNIYKRTRVLFVVDKETNEKVAVNETPFG